MAAQLEKSNSHLERNPILRSSLVDWASHGIITRDPDSQTQHSKKAKTREDFLNKFILIKFDEDKIQSSRQQQQQELRGIYKSQNTAVKSGQTGSRGLKHFVKRDNDKEDTKRKLKFWKIVFLEVQNNYFSFDTVCIERKQTQVAKSMYTEAVDLR